jgi:23S rRNA (uracil1939-C5)-methyltransferase
LVVAKPLPGSGAPGELVYQEAPAELTETLADTTITYPYDSFFQTNPLVFTHTLERIIESATGSNQVVELYSGVGAIGLPLARHVGQVTGIEVVPSAVEYAGRNAAANQIKNYKEIMAPAEAIEKALMNNIDTLIVDPPRAGLHPKVIRRIQEQPPAKLIYLSCNPVTQARDLAALLTSHYQAEPVSAFDFYPGTLHLESLAILNRR